MGGDTGIAAASESLCSYLNAKELRRQARLCSQKIINRELRCYASFCAIVIKVSSCIGVGRVMRTMNSRRDFTEKISMKFQLCEDVFSMENIETGSWRPLTVT